MRLTAALQLARTAGLASLCDASDAELLRRFCRDRDEAAFREILRRYEALVRGASRRLTRDRHAVEDAVQATFLTLARKADSIRHAEALPSWLYRVARSVTARKTATNLAVVEPVDPTPSPLDQLTAREALAIFDEELDRLVPAHRSAILLCNIEGNTVEDAARRLGTTPGTIRGWLQRGRDLLRRRMNARGVELSVALTLLAVASAGRAEPMRDAIVQAAMATHRPAPLVGQFLAGTSAVWTAAVGVLVAGVVSTLVLLSSEASDPQLVPTAKADRRAEAKADTLVARDGLPEGAVARIGSPRLRHAGDIVAMAFSRDGRLFATASPASRDKSVRVWNLADGKEKYRIPIAVNPHESSTQYRSVAVAFATDDKRLLVLDARGFQSFDVTTGRQEVKTVLFRETDPNQFFSAEGVIGVGFSPDAKTFAVVRQKGELLLGDTATGQVKRTVAKSMNVPENTHYSHVDVLFTPDGSEVCVPVSGGPVPVFDVTTGEAKRTLAKEIVPQNGIINNAAFAGGRTFLSVVTTPRKGKGPSYAVLIGDVATGKSLRTIPMPAMPRVLSVSPNGKLLAVSADSMKSSEVRVLDLESGKEVQSVPLALTPALVTFSPDSRLLAATCHYEGRVTVWDLGKNAQHPQSADETMFWAGFNSRGNVEFNRPGRRVTVDWRSGKVLEDRVNEPWALFADIKSEDGKLQAKLETRKDKPGSPLTVVIKETDTDRVVARLEGLSDYPRHTTFADQHRLFVTVTQDDVLSVWDVGAGKLLWSEKYPARAFGYRGAGLPYFDVANRRMAICSVGETETFIDVWELRQKTRVARVEVARVLLSRSIAFSPDGEFVAGGSKDVTCWRVSDGRAMRVLRGHAREESPNDRPGIRCQFSADGRKLLTVDESGTIRVWEFATGQTIRTFIGHNGPTTANFSPDARSIVGVSYDAPILIWDVYGLSAPLNFDANRVWADLAAASPEAAFRAVRELCASPKEAVALLKEKLKPESIDTKAIDGWVKDLSAERFAVRERATTELEKYGETIAPLLREALKASTDAEGRQRLAAILGRMERLSPADLRVRRALDALEHLGTPEAKKHLEVLSRGSPGCLRTLQAKEALSRISGR